MLKKILSAVLLCSLFGGSGLSGEEEIVRFKDAKIDVNQQLPPEKRGYTMEPGKDGLLVHFQKYKKDGGSSWPYAGVRGKEMKILDWTKYKYLLVHVRNHSQEISPTVTVVVRDTSGKLICIPCWVRCNSESELVIPVSEIGKKVNLAKINLLQFAMPNCGYDILLEFISASLRGEAGPADQNLMVPRTYDLKKEIVERKPGIRGTGSTLIENDPKGPVIRTKKYVPGDDKWPGLNVKTRVGGTFLDGDFSTKTHLVAELEHVDGQIGGLGLSFSDDHQKKFWHGIGVIDKNTTVKIDRMIYGMGIDLANVNSLSIGCTMPRHDNAFRINTLRLEFRPETLYIPALEKLDNLLKQNLDSSVRAQAVEAKKRLESAYALVKGESAKYGDIQNFIRLTETSKQLASTLLRSHMMRIVAENMKNYDYAVGVADSMTSVFLTGTGFIMKPAEKEFLEMAGNEYESFQTVVFSTKQPLKNVRVTVSELKGPKGATLQAETAVVGYAENRPPQYPVEHLGWYPDFIISYQQTADIAQNEPTPFWTRLKTPENAVPGLYRGTVTVTGDNLKSYSFPLEVKVFPFSLPTRPPLPLSLNMASGKIQKMYKMRGGIGSDFEKLIDRFIDQAADYNLTYDRLYYGPYTSLDRSKDLSFPRWKHLKERGKLTAFCILNATPHPARTKDPTNPDDPGVENLMELTGKHMDYWVPVAKELGLLENAYLYGFDEGHVDTVTNKVFGTLKKNYPQIPIMTTANIPSADIPGIENIDIWVPIARKYANNQELVKALRAKGKKVWWYVCNFPRPPEPTFLLEAPACVPRLLMGMMTQKYKPDGFLYWAIISWQEPQLKLGPVNCGPRTHWNPSTCQNDNEEGNFFVPGRNYTILPTIRVENFRDGMEDYHYYLLLEKLIRKRQGKAAPSLLRKAQEALNVPESLVKSTGSYTTDTEAIRAERSKIAGLIEALQK